MLVLVLLALTVLVAALLIDRVRLPAYLALMLAALAFGLAADMTFRSLGVTFGQGFVHGLEQAGLVVVAGFLARGMLIPGSTGVTGSTLLGFVSGVVPSAPAAMALGQMAAGKDQRALLVLALAILASHGVMPPSPIATAALAVTGADPLLAALSGGVAGVFGFVVALLVLRRLLGPATPSSLSLHTIVVLALPLALLILQSVAQMPSEPLGRGGQREFFIGISAPMVLLVLVLLSALIVRRERPGASLHDTSWAPLLLAVGASAGLGRMVDETGAAPLLAEHLLDLSLGLWTPLLIAALVKAMQGSSLSAVLTASGMIEPLLPALGLDDAAGRALAAAACGAGAIAVCHVNDPLFWIVQHCTRLSVSRTLLLLGGGGLLIAFGAGAALQLLRHML